MAHLIRLAALTTIMLAMIALPGAPAVADEPVSVQVTADAGGGRVKYIITVRNRGHQDHPQAEVIQLLDGGLRYAGAEPEPESAGTRIVWATSLPAGTTRTFIVRAETGDRAVAVAHAGGPTSPGLSATVCVRGTSGESLVPCQSRAAMKPWHLRNTTLLAAVGITALFAAVAAWALRRRRAPRP